MKRLIALMLVLVLALSLVACGKQEEITQVPVEDTLEESVEQTEQTEEVDEPEEEVLPELDFEMELPMLTPDGEIIELDKEEQQPATETLQILQNIWATYADGDKFAIMGGNPEAGVMDAPGSYDMAYAENLTYNLLIPEDKIVVVEEASTMIHMMNANTFTCGVVKLVDNVDAQAFADAVCDAILGNQWICGFPEKMAIVELEGCVLIAFGVNDAMTPFEANMAAAYPELKYFYSEEITG